MLDTIIDDHADLTSYPTTGVRIGINYHDQTIGKHRPRFSFDREVIDVLRRGLSYPRVQIDGTFVNGMRIWCAEKDGMAPTISKLGGWAFSLPVRRVRGREENVATREVPFSWERDDTGPVLIIPRLPDALLPEPVIDKLPNSQVDHETRMERAEKRLSRELSIQQIMDEEWPLIEPEPEPHPLKALLAEPNVPPVDVEPPTPTIVDLKEALQMVNELVEQLGDQVVLSIDENGHVRAKRRIVQFIDL